MAIGVVGGVVLNSGVFALAHATELVYGDDPSVAVWDTEKMRKHIINSVERMVMYCLFRNLEDVELDYGVL